MADVSIKVRAGGPYKVSGPARITDAGGRVVADGDTGQVVVLCRCGRTMDTPNCDGSHRQSE